MMSRSLVDLGGRRGHFRKGENMGKSSMMQEHHGFGATRGSRELGSRSEEHTSELQSQL